jgi:hypothetical protein
LDHAPERQNFDWCFVDLWTQFVRQNSQHVWSIPSIFHPHAQIQQMHVHVSSFIIIYQIQPIKKCQSHLPTNMRTPPEEAVRNPPILHHGHAEICSWDFDEVASHYGDLSRNNNVATLYPKIPKLVMFNGNP